MKLWNKGYLTEQIVDQFTVGNDRQLDLNLVAYDLLASKAHAKMLYACGLLSTTEKNAIINGLNQIEQEVEQGQFTIEKDFEDVHSKIEYALIQRIGETGKKIHTARSRNDQVLVALHLYIKAELAKIQTDLTNLFDTLITLSEKHKNVLIPGYTHMQVAMPSSFGLWFGAYAETLIDDLTFCKAAYSIADQNPLGSAAGYGTSFPIDRNITTQELGFTHLKYNVVAAQMSRGKLEKSTAFALSSIGGTLAKLATDICLYMSQNFNFVQFPKELTTGSSIMPHKQNPDVFELVRAKSNKIQNLPSEIILLTNNLTSGYHRDFQLLKESLMDAINTTKENLKISRFMLENIQVNPAAIQDEKYNYIYSVEAVNKLVMEGIPFREAYQAIGHQIMDNKYQPLKEVNHTHQGSIGNLCNAEIKEKLAKLLA